MVNTRDRADQFGDITSRVLTDADKTIAGWRDDTFNDLMPQLWQQLVGRLSEQERGDLVVAMVQLIECFLIPRKQGSN